VYDDKGKIDTALNYFFRSLKIREEIGEKYGITNSCFNIAYSYKKLKEIDKALEYATRSLKLAKEIGYPEDISRSAELLYTIYKSQHKSQLALDMFELYMHMKDSINNLETKESSY
jgi:tetratricopeptide (TPR) repeat protein